jgi:hypothetical protein
VPRDQDSTGVVELPHGGHVCRQQTELMAWVRALVSKLGGEVTLDDELLALMQYTPLEITRATSDDGWRMVVVGVPFGRPEPEDIVG